MSEGIKAKYKIEHVDGRPIDPKAEYFVLRLDYNAGDRDHVRACRHAVNEYCGWIEHKLPELATELRKRYPI